MNRLFAVLDRPPVVGLEQVTNALFALARAEHRVTVFERLATATSASTASRAAAVIILQRMATLTDDNGPLTSIRLATEKISLSPAEDNAVTAWTNTYLKTPDSRRRHTGQTVAVADHLADLADATGPDTSLLSVIRDGLRSAAKASFGIVKDGHRDIAVPVTAEAGDPATFIAAIQDPDIAVAFELALDTCSPSFWAVEALLGWAVKPALDRLPVGPAVLQLVRSAEEKTMLQDL